MNQLTSSLERNGFFLLRGAFAPADCDHLLAEWTAACERAGDKVMRADSGAVYGARNIIELWPEVLHVLQRRELTDTLAAILGANYGLVRTLYFDKPPGESWALPWHKDLAIAVQDNRIPSEQFRRPTTKHGVPHVEAPRWLLEQMLTARLHLDDVTEENGPLRVLPGSHNQGTNSENEYRVLCAKGDVLLIRPLLSHSSGHSQPGTNKHRRILHFEFSPVRELPDGYEWQTFLSSDKDNHGFHGSHR